MTEKYKPLKNDEMAMFCIIGNLRQTFTSNIGIEIIREGAFKSKSIGTLWLHTIFLEHLMNDQGKLMNEKIFVQLSKVTLQIIIFLFDT